MNAWLNLKRRKNNEHQNYRFSNRNEKLQALAEDGELTPEMIKDTLEGLEGMIGDKLDATIAVVRGFEGQANVCDVESKRLAARKKSWDNQAGLLKNTSLNAY